MKNQRKIVKIDKLWYMLLLAIIFIGIFATINYYKYDILKFYKISYREMYGKHLSNEDINNLRKSMNINEIKYEWEEELEYNNKPTKIIYHHSASFSKSAESIHEFHKAKGWSGIGYQYYIRKDGTIYSGRPEEADGAHTIGENKSSIGICLEGNFEDEEISSEQVQSLYKLSVYVSLKYDIYKIIGHGDAGETLCPGKNFPLETMRKSVIYGIESFNDNKNELRTEYNSLN